MYKCSNMRTAHLHRIIGYDFHCRSIDRGDACNILYIRTYIICKHHSDELHTTCIQHFLCFTFFGSSRYLFLPRSVSVMLFHSTFSGLQIIVAFSSTLYYLYTFLPIFSAYMLSAALYSASYSYRHYT